MNKILPYGSTIGIIGAGQLGKMLALSAQKMGYEVAMFDPNPTSCGFGVANRFVVANFNDKNALLDFVKSVDVLTYEFENIDAEILNEVAMNAYFPQGVKLLLISQHRLKEKIWLNSLGIKTVNFMEISNFNDVKNYMKFPFILKTSRFGYDGKSQIKINSAKQILQKKLEIEKLLENESILEEFCDFKCEISVIVARDLSGEIKIFPISKNKHINGILFSSIVGKKFSQKIEDEIKNIACKIAKEGELIGVCGIEFFVDKNDNILVNEIAPRPHNSGHYTIESCFASQFDEHILAISGRNLAQIKLYEPALMINILGAHLPFLDMFKREFPNAIYHIYNKKEVRNHRKMGHITFTDQYEKLEKIVKKLPDKWLEIFN